MWPIGPDDRDAVPTPQTKAMKAYRVGTHLVQQQRPGPSFPNAEDFVPHRRPGGQSRGVTYQQFGERIRTFVA
jgi:hypothetical protein